MTIGMIAKTQGHLPDYTERMIPSHICRKIMFSVTVETLRKPELMLAPSLPHNETARLATLRTLKLLDTPAEERFDRLTRLARRLFDVPIALVSLIDENRQWFKSCAGLGVQQTSRDVSFCGHAILHDDAFVIPDALADERFYDNPLVTGEPGIRFYAGQPLVVPNGSKLGTLCLIDKRPREFDTEERGLLRDLAQIAEQEIAAIELATIDELTLLANRRGFEVLAQHGLNLCKRLDRHASLLFFDLDGFKQINDRFGHAAGDACLKAFAERLKAAFCDAPMIARIGGDEFALLVDTSLSPPALERYVSRLLTDLTRPIAWRGQILIVGASAGIALPADPHRYDAEGLSAMADKALYAAKAAGRGTVRMDEDWNSSPELAFG
jgi:diguanylate cyclase (GGDEF)-like protein